MRVIYDAFLMKEDKFYFYAIYTIYFIEFDTEEEANKWLEESKRKDKYFGYNGYWLKDGKSAINHFIDRSIERKDDFNE